MAKVSIVMPVYNGEKYLSQSVQSMLNQTFLDFEFLIADDGSMDGSRAIMEKLTDSRIKIIRHNTNRGLVETLNEAFKIAAGEFIVRMDQDDISTPTRIQEQINFLEKNPEVSVVASYCETIEPLSRLLKYPISHENIKVHALFDCPIAHPTVALRKKSLSVPAYDPSFLHAEDYELWTRLLDQNIKFRVLPKVLLKYRIHQGQTLQQSRGRQIATADTVRAFWLGKLGIHLTEEEMKVHRSIAHGEFEQINFDVQAVSNHLIKIEAANKEKLVFNHSLLRLLLAEKMMLLFLKLPPSYSLKFNLIFAQLKKNPRLLFKPSFYKICFLYCQSALKKKR